MEKFTCRGLVGGELTQVRGDPARSEIFDPSHVLGDLAAMSDADFLGIEREVKIAGRVVAVRDHKKTIFVDLEDETGRVQVALEKEKEEESVFQIGAVVGVSRPVLLTKSGEKTVHALDCFLVAASTIEGKDDLLGRGADRADNPVIWLLQTENRRALEVRWTVLRTVRRFLEERKYQEVQTPILMATVGGANARKFETRLDVRGRRLQMRISPELPLKMMIIAGYPRVFEVGQSFRNEGVDRNHSPEFTLLEFYTAFGTCAEAMILVEEMLGEIVQAIHGQMAFPYLRNGQGCEVDFSPKWPRYRFFDLLGASLGLPEEKLWDDEFLGLLVSAREDVAREAEVREISAEEFNRCRWEKKLDLLYKWFVLPRLVQPTFIVGHPVEMLPLARTMPGDTRFANSAQLVIAGVEVAKIYQEEHDPVLQRQKLELQACQQLEGDDEAMEIDEPYLRAMGIGMVPTAGVGIGIDRLVALLANRPSLRDVQAFTAVY